MSAKNRTRLFLESLEDRAVPTVTYTLDSVGDMTVTGSTLNSTFSITSSGNDVTFTDGALTTAFSVTGNLTVNLQMLSASLAQNFNYLPGDDSSGAVSLTVLGRSSVNLCAAGAAAPVNVLGQLSITTGNTNDHISVSNINPAGLNINTGAGYDLVEVGFSSIPGCPNGPVTVQGNLQARNVNAIGLGTFGGDPVTVQGVTSISTDNAISVSFANPNNIDIEPNTTLEGTLIATLNGAFELFSTQGTQLSNVYTQFGNGHNLALFQDTQITSGSVTLTATIGASFDLPSGGGVTMSGQVGGNIQMVMGNGRNDVAFHVIDNGRSIKYYGGSGVDNVQWAMDANAFGAALNFNLGAGDDVLQVNNSNWTSALFDGGFGTNSFLATVPLSPTTTVRNF
jgi:hypothetical protein